MKEPAEKPGFYAIVPAVVRYSQDLPPNAKLIYGDIAGLAADTGFCWANNRFFAQCYEVSITSVSKWINTLQQQGFIRVEYIKLKRQIYPIADTLEEKLNPITKVKAPLEEKLKPPLTKVKGPLEEKFKHSIIINNTVNNTESNTALDFLKSNYPGRLETWEMKYKKQILDYDKFWQDFNSTVDIEELRFADRVLFARLDKYANNWIRNQVKFNKGQQQQPETVPVYLRKCSV